MRSLTSEDRRTGPRSSEIEQLQTQNAMLEIIARSVDVPLAFQALASRIARLVPCDRVGLALLTENGEEFQTYTARVQKDERRARPRPEIVFKVERTVIGSVVRSREPLIVDDMTRRRRTSSTPTSSHTPGFGSALIVPLVSKGRAVGTLNLVCDESRNAFDRRHIERAAADRGDLRGRRRRAAAAVSARQVPDRWKRCPS